MYKITQTVNGETTSHGPFTKQELIESFGHLGKKVDHWIPFIDKDSFKSIELVTEKSNISFVYKIELCTT